MSCVAFTGNGQSSCECREGEIGDTTCTIISAVPAQCKLRGLQQQLLVQDLCGRGPGLLHDSIILRDPAVTRALKLNINLIPRFVSPYCCFMVCALQALSNVLWGLATLDHDPGSGFWTAAEARLTQLALDCEAQHLSNAAWAFAKLQRQPSACDQAAAMPLVPAPRHEYHSVSYSASEVDTLQV